MHKHYTCSKDKLLKQVIRNYIYNLLGFLDKIPYKFTPY